mgnify:CR=1 FL=1
MWWHIVQYKKEKKLFNFNPNVGDVKENWKHRWFRDKICAFFLYWNWWHKKASEKDVCYFIILVQLLFFCMFCYKLWLIFKWNKFQFLMLCSITILIACVVCGGRGLYACCFYQFNSILIAPLVVLKLNFIRNKSLCL